MVYFRELPVPLKEVDPAFLEIFFDFANTYTEKSVMESIIKHRQEKESKPTAEIMKRMGYSDEEIAGMDLRDAAE
ncbi:MAG: hypothetical protein LBH43_19045 [Treponema sp.]|nr:hypothetical protein [Treponema sp.]